MRMVLVGLLVVVGVWFVFDGVRALTTGAYTTPSSGQWAGHLGPWAEVVEAVGLDPMGVPVRLGHVLSGVIALAAAFTVAAGWGTLAWVLGYLAAATMVWYVPIGTVIGVTSAVLLGVPAVRVEIRGR